MKPFSSLFAAIGLFSFQLVSATSVITFYSDDECTTLLGVESGPDNGTCTQFESSTSTYGSFMVTTLDQTCAVTVYGNDVAYCSSNKKSISSLGSCMTNTTVNQFSVDCTDVAAATSDAPAVAATATAITHGSSSSGLSTGAKAGIGIGAAIGGLLLVAILVFFVVRNNKKKRQAAKSTEESGVLEADSTPAVPPYSSELPPDEKKPPVELPPHHTGHPVVEAPGDEHWPAPRELEGDRVQSEMEGSMPSQSQADVKSGVGSDSTKPLLPDAGS
jgi:hypothetical protein